VLRGVGKRAEHRAFESIGNIAFDRFAAWVRNSDRPPAMFQYRCEDDAAAALFVFRAHDAAIVAASAS
jgi:hypothetical protein